MALPRLLPGLLPGLIVAAMVMFAASGPANANPRYAAFVMDAATGEVLHARYADRPLFPASLTKLMTLYMVFQALDRGDVSLDQRIPISRNAAAEPPSKLGIPAGGSIRLQDAIYSLVTRSANDVATAVGEALGGSEARFAQMMTQEARRLGMSSTTFQNAHGLPNTQQISTARDMGTLAQAHLRDFPHYYHYFSTRSWTYNGTTHRNHNHLMSSYEGMDGLKTGFIRASGFNLAATAVRGNLRLITVLFGGQTADSRNRAVAQLLDQAFESERGRYLIAHGTTSIQRFAAPLPPQRPVDGSAFTGLAGSRMPDRVLEPLPARFAGFPEPAFHPRRQQVAGASPATAPPPAPAPGPSGETVGQQVVVRASAEAPVSAPSISASSSNSGFHAVAGALTNGSGDGRIAALVQGNDIVVDNVEQGSTDVTASSSDRINHWGIQVGAFSDETAGQTAIQNARSRAPDILNDADGVILRINSANGPLYRARLVGFSQDAAAMACTQIMSAGNPCLTIAPNTAF